MRAKLRWILARWDNPVAYLGGLVTLRTRYLHLVGTCGTLKQELRELQGKYDSLKKEHGALLSAFVPLSTERNDLRRRLAISLQPKISVHQK